MVACFDCMGVVRFLRFWSPTVVALTPLIAAGRSTLSNFDVLLQKIATSSCIQSNTELRSALQLLQKWHWGCLEWAAFLERIFWRKASGPAARLIRSFVIGGNAHGLSFAQRAPQVAVPQRTQQMALPPPKPATNTDSLQNAEVDAIIEALKWVQRIEILIASGWHDHSIPKDWHDDSIPDDSMCCADLMALSDHASNSDLECSSDASADAGLSETKPSDFGETVFLLSFTRADRHLKQALSSGRELEPVRQAARDAHQNIKLETGAWIFVQPWNYQAALGLTNRDFRPHHAIVTQTFLPLVQAELDKLPRCSNVKLRRTPTVIGILPHEVNVAVHCQVRHDMLEHAGEHSALSPTTRSLP